MSAQKSAEMYRVPGKGKREPKAMLEAAISVAHEFDEVIVIAKPKEGSPYPLFFSASHARNPDILWDMECARLALMDL